MKKLTDSPSNELEYSGVNSRRFLWSRHAEDLNSRQKKRSQPSAVNLSLGPKSNERASSYPARKGAGADERPINEREANLLKREARLVEKENILVETETGLMEKKRDLRNAEALLEARLKDPNIHVLRTTFRARGHKIW